MSRCHRPIARLLAFHEAGHAVCGELVGCPVDYVTIRPIIGMSGHCAFMSATRKLSPDESMMLDLAGLVAEGMVQPNAHEFRAKFGGRASRIERDKVWLAPIVPRISELASPLCPVFTKTRAPTDDQIILRDDLHSFTLTARLHGYDEATEAEIAALTARIGWKLNQLLYQRWSALEMIADELLVFDRVDGDRVREIIAGKPLRDLPQTLPAPATRAKSPRSPALEAAPATVAIDVTMPEPY